MAVLRAVREGPRFPQLRDVRRIDVGQRAEARVGEVARLAVPFAGRVVGGEVGAVARGVGRPWHIRTARIGGRVRGARRGRALAVRLRRLCARDRRRTQQQKRSSRSANATRQRHAAERSRAAGRIFPNSISIARYVRAPVPPQPALSPRGDKICANGLPLSIGGTMKISRVRRAPPANGKRRRTTAARRNFRRAFSGDPPAA